MGAQHRGAAWRALAERVARCGWRAILARSVTLACGWLIITRGDLEGLGFGCVVVLAAVASSLWLPQSRPLTWRLLGTARFAVAFLSGSLLGGVDVARRALSRRLSIDPALIDYPLGLPPGPARNLFLGTVSLMPGTLCANVEGARCQVHVLTQRPEGFVQELGRLEGLIAVALGERLERAP